jgi:hypothetical protein
LVLYEVANVQALASEAYLTRLNHPTPWTTRMMPHYRGMTRGLCAVVGSFGYGLGGAAALIRFTPDDSAAPALQRWLLEEVLPAVPPMSGLGSAHLLEEAQPAAMTIEQGMRGADCGIDAAIIVTGYDRHAVSTYAKSLCAAEGLPKRGARELTSAIYGSSYSLTSAELDA